MLGLAATASDSSRTLAQVPSPGDATPQSGCLSGYPNSTYQGDRPVSRYELAAGLNACLNQTQRVLPTNTTSATRADFEALVNRQRELNKQLRELSDRVSTPPAN